MASTDRQLACRAAVFSERNWTGWKPVLLLRLAVEQEDAGAAGGDELMFDFPGALGDGQAVGVFIGHGLAIGQNHEGGVWLPGMPSRVICQTAVVSS